MRKRNDGSGYPYTVDDITVLDGKTEMDALVAYLSRLGKELKQ